MPREDTLRRLSALYAAAEDPWAHLTSPYERAKYEATLAACGPGPLACAVEVGCGIGALTARLAPRCARLIALDCIPAAVARARARTASLPNVEILEGQAPEALPALAPDLVLFSEVLYFLTPEEIDACAAWAARAGRIVSVNWTGDTAQALTGEEAADRLAAALSRRPTRRREEGYLLDVF